MNQSNIQITLCGIIANSLIIMMNNLLNSNTVSANPVSFLSYSIGSQFSCAVSESGNMKCWGNNGSGQLGLGDLINRGDNSGEMGDNLPLVNLGEKIKSVFCGATHACAILDSDATKCWGLNNNGQLGLGDLINRGSKVTDMGNALQSLNLGSTFTPIQMAIGSLHTCVLSVDQAVKCIGDGANGALGYENVNDIGSSLSQLGNNLPTVNLGNGVKALSIHSFGEAFHNCITTTTQTVKCWGKNTFAQLGYGDTNNRGALLNTMGAYLDEVDLGIVSTVKQVAVGALHTCALRTDGVLKCFGSNSSAQLGIGLIGSLVSLVGDLLGQTLVDTGKAIQQISAGRDHTCMLLDDLASVKCIGGNSHGQLGLGDLLTRGNTILNTADKLLPINLGTGSLKIESVSAGGQTTCIIFADASMKCMGDGSNGALGLGLKADVGSILSQLGSSLPFVNVFGSSTKAPTTLKPTSKSTSSPSSSPSAKVTTTSKPTTPSPTIKPSSNSGSNPTTRSPTYSPTKPCTYTTKTLCKKDSKCLWVKQNKLNICVEFDCSKLKKGKCAKSKTKCSWNTATSLCNKRV